jgi:hypothetical protein
MKNKKRMKKLNTYFLIVNLVLAIAAFNYLVSAQEQNAGRDANIVRNPTSAKSPLSAIQEFFKENYLLETLFFTAIGTGLGSLAGLLAGGKDGAGYGALAGGAGSLAGMAALKILPKLFTDMPEIYATWFSIGIGLGVGALIFALTYKKESKEIVEFNCRPFEPPIGGADCEKCNQFEECSEYTCKSLGQACDLVNTGTKEQKCIWKNPRDVISPLIKTVQVNKGLKYKPDTNIRPPATGIVISKEDGSCIKAFTPLEFTLITDEPSQCKIDYNLTNKFDDMSYYFGGSNLFDYNHTEKLSLPGPDSINKIAPELKNDGTYTLYVRCQDANGNFNQDSYSVRFCVEKGPDTTPPKIENVNIPSGSAIQFNRTSSSIEVYVNEPSECKWSRENKAYNNMENNFSCDINLWEMNTDNVYTCRTTLTGIESRKENTFYFRCKDKPGFEEKDRNVNTESYNYLVAGTQPLNIMESGPTKTVYGATETIPIFLTIKTDNGYKDGEANCYYKNSLPANDEDYIKFLETGTNEHKQRQDLTTGNYTYYFKCVDLGGNAAYNTTSFKVETDKISPIAARVYKEVGELKIKTSEDAECGYSNKDCNFEIDAGIKMETEDYRIHTAEWKLNQNYYIRCKDKYNNQPSPNACSIIARPSLLTENAGETTSD